MHRVALSVFFVLAAVCLAFAASANTASWRRGDRVTATEKHTVVFAVSNVPTAAATCDSLLMAVSTPVSTKYGQFLTIDQVSKIFGDSQALHAVLAFLERQKADNWEIKSTASGDFITLTAPVAGLDALLNAQFHYYHAVSVPSIRRSSVGYSVPTEIAEHVDFVGGVDSFPPVKHHHIRSHELSSPYPANSVFPSLINKVYNIASNLSPTTNNSMALFEALGQDFSPADLQTFQQEFGVRSNPVKTVIGPNNPNTCLSNPNDCGEANLDVQYITSIAQNVDTTYWSISTAAQDPFLDWIVALANISSPPLVHSISYGSIATEDSHADVGRFNLETCKLGLRGLTIVISSGDDGVANFEARNDPSQCGFHPSFPATSPYATAVGATQGPESGRPEIACSSSTGGVVTTGGGFSYYFPRPAYQAAAVSSYLRSAPNLPPLALFNASSRGYPDVAVIGYNYNVVLGGNTYLESGTSASAPVFAGMIALINGALIAQGKSPVGFANPALYSLAATRDVFNDITVGENNCCAGYPGQFICCQYGFNATRGWDPLTGLGSPKFSNLRAAFLALKQ
eukprot:TRINITY_DN116_c0_g1_i1.p1 TRINITY_DN116_c0_g1~~TRINITY_DN116_c0_g1_i1.p1  ORF type:complete len:570 (+),score=74.79 TRINITY_DN116_c0_g1_i1:169-1878(+)